MRDPMRLGVVTTHPIQYQVPLWRALSDDPGIDLTVLYASRQGLDPYFDEGFGQEIAWDGSLGQGYGWRVLENRPLKPLGWRFAFNCPDVKRVIDRDHFDAVLMIGKEYWFYQQAISSAVRHRVPILYRAETPPPKDSRLELAIAHWQRGRLFRRFAACLCVGHAQRDLYRGYGVPEERLHWAPYCVDNDFFRRAAEHYGAKRDVIRMRFGVDDDRPVVAFAAKFIERKRPLDLVHAFAAMPDRSRYALVMAGSGPLLDECRRFVREQRMPNVSFPGFLNQGEIGALYAAADCFVLPSEHETWGLVVNEAMNFSLPIITSDGVGAGADLVRDGENGFRYRVGDIGALRDRLTRVLAADGAIERMGHRSRELVADYSISATVEGVKSALDAVQEEATR